MQKTNALPRYVEISEMLIRDIAAGRLINGDRLPAEREMAGDLGIAVGTLRKALAELTAQGYLERVQGSGNYVRQSDSSANIYAFFRLELPGGGGLPTADLLSLERRKKPSDLPVFGRSDEGHRIRRLRRLNDIPIAVEEIWLDGSYVDHIAPDDLADALYYYYKNRLGLRISRAEDRIGAAEAPEWTPPPLSPGRNCGFIERISWEQHGASAEYSRTWFDPARAVYISRLK